MIVAGLNPLHHLFPSDRERASPYQPSDRRFIDPIWLDAGAPCPGGPVIDYPAVWAHKAAVLRARFAGWSAAVLLTELGTIYTALASGEVPDRKICPAI